MGFSLSHLIILFVVVLLFGARRLPELGSSLGKGLRSFKKGIEGIDDEPKDPKKIASEEEEEEERHS
jgi:sec-independent protein translocase protein TatA